MPSRTSPPENIASDDLCERMISHLFTFLRDRLHRHQHYFDGKLHPILRWMPGRILAQTFNALDFVDHAVDWIILTGWSGIADQCQNCYRLTDVGYIETAIGGFQRLQDSYRTTLAIIRLATPPDYAKDFAGVKVINSDIPFIMIKGGITKTDIAEMRTHRVTGLYRD